MAEISRREFLKVSTVAAAGIVAQACAKKATEAPTKPAATKAAEPTATTAPAPEPEAGKQAPMLADMVSSGALPALDQPAVLRVDMERTGEVLQRLAAVAAEAPIAGKVVMGQGLPGMTGQCPFERVDGHLDLAGPLVAPPQREPHVDVLGCGFGSADQRNDRLLVTLQFPQRLSPQV